MCLCGNISERLLIEWAEKQNTKVCMIKNTVYLNTHTFYAWALTQKIYEQVTAVIWGMRPRIWVGRNVILYSSSLVVKIVFKHAKTVTHIIILSKYIYL